MRASNVGLIREKADTYDALPGMDAPDRKIWTILNSLCQDLDKDLAVFLDEAALLTGKGLLTSLAQIRDGYILRHKPGNKFPRALGLAGMRDIRDHIAGRHPDHAGDHFGQPVQYSEEKNNAREFHKSTNRPVPPAH
jgi:hypothetical protein